MSCPPFGLEVLLSCSNNYLTKLGAAAALGNESRLETASLHVQMRALMDVDEVDDPDYSITTEESNELWIWIHSS